TAPGLTVNTGGTVTVDNTNLLVNVNRIADTSQVTLNGGTFNYLGSPFVASTETVGVLALGNAAGGGNSTVNATNGNAQTATLTFASLTRNAGATVNFTAGAGQT